VHRAGQADPGPVRLRAAGARERRSRSCPACITTATSQNAMRRYPDRRRTIAAHSGVADLP